MSFPCQVQPNHLLDILSSLGYSVPGATFGDTHKVYKDNLSLCCMSDKEVEKIHSEMLHMVIDITEH